MPPANPRAVARTRRPAVLAERVTLAETLDRVLNKGAVIVGDVTISIADIDLIYLGLNVVACSVETLRKMNDASEPTIGGTLP